MTRHLVTASLALCAGLLSGCGPLDPEVVRLQCEERARAAQGPTGRVTVGANSDSGPYAGVQIGITADALAGRDPVDVYNRCVYERTGALPTVPPDLS